MGVPELRRAILLIEDVDKHIGAMDRTLTQLLESGSLDGLKGVAVGGGACSSALCSPAARRRRAWRQWSTSSRALAWR